jgi:hypothetical protein
MFNLGLDRAVAIAAESCHQELLLSLLDRLNQLPDLDQLAFLLATGEDPFNSLQVSLDRQVFQRSSAPGAETKLPSSLANQLTTQRIYLFASPPGNAGNNVGVNLEDFS